MSSVRVQLDEVSLLNGSACVSRVYQLLYRGSCTVVCNQSSLLNKDKEVKSEAKKSPQEGADVANNKCPFQCPGLFLAIFILLDTTTIYNLFKLTKFDFFTVHNFLAILIAIFIVYKTQITI